MTLPAHPPYRSPLRYRVKRWRGGCLYLGCAAPALYAVLVVWIILDSLARAFRRHARILNMN